MPDERTPEEKMLDEAQAALENGDKGRARDLLTSDLVGANNLLDAATRLVQTDQDKTGVYYYRAQVMEALKNGQAAILAWQALLKLPPKGIPADWLTTANQHLQSLITLTPSPTR